MRRFALIALAALLIVGPLATPVSAGKGWCRSDPIVSLNGVELQLWIAIPAEAQGDVIGPIAITFSAPRAAKLAILYTDAGFNGLGESISVAGNSDRIEADGKFTVKAIISVPMRGNQFVPMQVEVVPESGESVFVEGQAVGMSITLNLDGQTILETVTEHGAVIPSPVTTASDTSSPTPTELPAESATSEPMAEPTARPTEAPEATGDSAEGDAPAADGSEPSTGDDQSAEPVPTEEATPADGTGDEPVADESEATPADEDAAEVPSDGESAATGEAVQTDATPDAASDETSADVPSEESVTSDDESTSEATADDDEVTAESAETENAEVAPPGEATDEATGHGEEVQSVEAPTAGGETTPSDDAVNSVGSSEETQADGTVAESTRDTVGQDDSTDPTPTLTPSPTSTSTASPAIHSSNQDD